MKPPSRRRVRPSRFAVVKKTEQKQKREVTAWNRQEQRQFLYGLKKLALGNSDLDLSVLQKRVPKRSILEIESFIKSLKNRVVQRVSLQVHKQKREERKAKVPIEVWAELAQRIAGSHGDSISAAFTQMLVIAATEPQSFVHSDPPRPINAPAPLSTSLRTVPLRPMLRTQQGSRLPSASPPLILPKQSHQISEATTVATSPHAGARFLVSSPLAQPSSSTALNDRSKGLLQGSTTCSASAYNILQTLDSTANSNQTVMKSALATCTQSTKTGPALLSLPSNSKQQSKETQDIQPTPVGLKWIVDFSKMYRFLSTINSNTGELSLSAMESAVLLDLLMSLPEELPLLDCKELQHHFLQVYSGLTSSTEVPGSALCTAQGLQLKA
ncbi:snRNA-activating protein complex subunit 2 [Chanos chanos]|uniref:snRNA-activating protein complex subunit 2 n=1 Tax=Chanos chanos TaxID=29144 RepID=A0A6J2VV61_CHACN|nr:snRNA-activating protein complex subunit 2 [Chanos chanos]